MTSSFQLKIDSFNPSPSSLESTTETTITIMSVSLTRNTLGRNALRLATTKRASHASASLTQSRGNATLPDLPCD